MRKILVDTDIFINFLRGKEKAKDLLSSLIEESSIHCSAITVAEIHAGMKEHEREMTTELIDSLNVIDITREIAEKAGSYKRRLRHHRLELDDCIVAATAFVNHAALATGNGRHYPMDDIEKITVSSG